VASGAAQLQQHQQHEPRLLSAATRSETATQLSQQSEDDLFGSTSLFSEHEGTGVSAIDHLAEAGATGATASNNDSPSARLDSPHRSPRRKRKVQEAGLSGLQLSNPSNCSGGGIYGPTSSDSNRSSSAPGRQFINGMTYAAAGCTGSSKAPTIKNGGLNEDRFQIANLTLDRSEDNALYVGVFDGHGGPGASTYLFEHFLDSFKVVLDREGREAPLEDVLHHSFMEADRSLFSDVERLGHEFAHLRDERCKCNFYRESPCRCLRAPRSAHEGSTATVLLYTNNRLYCANVGDSEAVLVTRSGYIRSTNDTGGRDFDTPGARSAVSQRYHELMNQESYFLHQQQQEQQQQYIQAQQQQQDVSGWAQHYAAALQSPPGCAPSPPGVDYSRMRDQSAGDHQHVDTGRLSLGYDALHVGAVGADAAAPPTPILDDGNLASPGADGMMLHGLISPHNGMDSASAFNDPIASNVGSSSSSSSFSASPSAQSMPSLSTAGAPIGSPLTSTASGMPLAMSPPSAANGVGATSASVLAGTPSTPGTQMFGSGVASYHNQGTPSVSGSLGLSPFKTVSPQAVNDSVAPAMKKEEAGESAAEVTNISTDGTNPIAASTLPAISEAVGVEEQSGSNVSVFNGGDTGAPSANNVQQQQTATFVSDNGDNIGPETVSMDTSEPARLITRPVEPGCPEVPNLRAETLTIADTPVPDPLNEDYIRVKQIAETRVRRKASKTRSSRSDGIRRGPSSRHNYVALEGAHSLNMTRAFGNFGHKVFSQDQRRTIIEPQSPIIVRPHVNIFEPAYKDDFLFVVVASDGLWDNLRKDEVSSIVRDYCLQRLRNSPHTDSDPTSITSSPNRDNSPGGNDVQDESKAIDSDTALLTSLSEGAAEDLLSHALKRNRKLDDITVVVVLFSSMLTVFRQGFSS